METSEGDPRVHVERDPQAHVARFEPPGKIKWLNAHRNADGVVAFGLEYAEPVATPGK